MTGYLVGGVKIIFSGLWKGKVKRFSWLLYFFGGLLFVGNSHLHAAAQWDFYVPATIGSHALQTKLASSCPDFKITVFGYAKDFRRKLAGSPPDIVLTLPLLLQKNHYQRIAVGLRAGKNTEPYMLVSVSKSLNPKKLLGVKLGVVDLLGRKSMRGYVSELAGQPMKIIRVTKIQDLLPVLTFQSDAAILTPERFYDEFKEKSKLQLIARPLDWVREMPVVAARTLELKSSAMLCLQGWDVKVMESLGVDAWELL